MDSIHDSAQFSLLLVLTLMTATGCSAPADAETTPMLPVDGARWPLPDETSLPAVDMVENPWLDWGTGGSSATEPTSASDDPTGAISAVPSGGREGGPNASSTPDDVLAPEVPAPLLTRRLVQYWEGSGSEKMLQIVGQMGVSPSPCTVEIYSNGGTEPWRRVALPDEFPTPTITLCSSAVTDVACSHELSGSLFNGNDALVLRCDDRVMDSLGRVGEDPGVAWRGTGADAASTEGQHLVRCDSEPDEDPFDPFFLEAWVPTNLGIMEAISSCEAWRPRGAGGAGGASNP